MTEREFVLNNFYNVYIHIKELELCGEEESIIQALKQTYKTICENTSEESETVKELDHIIEFIGLGGLTDIAQMHVKKQLFDLKNKIQPMV